MDEFKSYTVILEFRGKAHKVKAGMTLRSSLEKIGVNPESVLAIKDDQMITDDEILNESERVRLIAVISGG